MSLTISNAILDEELRIPATGPGTTDENEVAAATYNVSTIKGEVDSLTLTYVSSPTGFPQFAQKTNFVTSSNPVTDYYLTLSSNGVATDLYVGSNQIFLYATDNPDIVVGRVGNGTTADADGDVALVIGVDDSTISSPDLWMALYAPLVHDGLNMVDSADQLDLSDLVSLGSTFSTITEIPFENFAGVAPGNNLFNVIFPSDGSTGAQLLLTGSAGESLKTVNVSSTGIGAGSQHIDVGATLRIDTVTGMVQDNVNQAPEVNQSSNIDYTGRVEIIKADFEVSQVNPSSTPERVDILISAFNAAGAQQEGAYLTDAIASDGVAVQIDAADVRILDDAGNDITAAWLALAGTEIIQMGDSVKILGLNDGASNSTTDGDRVQFTTDGVVFDRFLITNVDGSTTLDVANIHVTAVQGGSDDESEELGSHLIFQDDGPNIDLASGATVPTVTDDETAFSTNNSASFSALFGAPDYGADGAGSLSYLLGVKSANVDSGLDDTLSGQNVVLSYDSATNTVYGKTQSSGLEVFKITVDSSGNITLDQSRAVVHGNTGSFDENSTAMTSDLITLTAKVVDSEAANHNDSDTATANIGGAFIFKDDGPALTPQAAGSLTPNNLEVANGGSDSSSYGLVPGADGQATNGYTIVGPADSSGTFRWSYDNASHTSITGTYVDALNVSHNLYTLGLNQSTGAYTFNMTGTLPSSVLNLSTAEIKAGAPDTNSIQVGAIENDDYVVIAGGGGAINESNGFVGVKNGNLDTGESLTFTLWDGAPNPDEQLYFQGLIIGTKSAQASSYNVHIDYVDPSLTDFDYVQNVGKNTPIVIDPAGDDLIQSITLTKASGPALKIGVGDIDILIPPDDIQLGFTVELKDGDGDTTNRNFTVDIDGNNDGNYDASVNASSVINPLGSALYDPFAHYQQDHLLM